MTPSIRLIMLGTGDFALPTFEHLIDTGHHVVALITQPDRPQGRKQEIIESLIKKSAVARGVLTLQPEDVNSPESLDLIRSLHADLLVTAAYGQILSPTLLAIPRLGGINLHGSILPAYRGAAPVARAIQYGETETGITVIRMTPRIDAGGIAATATTRDRARRDSRRARKAACASGRTSDRTCCRCARGGLDQRRASRQDKSHEGPEAPQGRRSDRLEAARSSPFTTSSARCSRGPQPRPPGARGLARQSRRFA